MIRAINYHDITNVMIADFECQLDFYRQHFDNVDEAKLEELVLSGTWSGQRPGLAITFDDGYASHAAIAAPLLERYGFTGWFFVPAGLVGQVPADGIPRMGWGELRNLVERHIVGCHSITHVRLAATLSEREIETEIIESKAVLERGLGRPVRSFCWVGGEEWSYSRSAAEAIRRAGYRLSFMTNSAPIRHGSNPLQLQRTNIEANYPIDLVMFQLCGILDMVYWPKRTRVNRLTRA